MSPELEQRLYDQVLQNVIWGTEREEVFQMMQASGVVGEPAERLFRQAWKERVSLLRSEGRQKAVKGVLVLIGGVSVFCAFWFGLGMITRAVLIGCAVTCGCGAWWILHGLMDAVLAPTRKGSVASADD